MSGQPLITYPIDRLSREWQNTGRRLGHPMTHGCVVAGCRSMAFVALKTGGGGKPVCYRHYQFLDQSNPLA